jgi:hypothetical protein
MVGGDSKLCAAVFIYFDVVRVSSEKRSGVAINDCRKTYWPI